MGGIKNSFPGQKPSIAVVAGPSKPASHSFHSLDFPHKSRSLSGYSPNVGFSWLTMRKAKAIRGKSIPKLESHLKREQESRARALSKFSHLAKQAIRNQSCDRRFINRKH